MLKESSRLYFHQVWLIVGCGLIGMVIYLSLNSGGVPVINSLLNDKVSHVLGYAGLMLWFLQLYKSLKVRCLFAGFLVCMGVALEYLQDMGGVRVFEIADMVANASGVTVGWLMALAGLDRILFWFERRYLVRG